MVYLGLTEPFGIYYIKNKKLAVRQRKPEQKYKLAVRHSWRRKMKINNTKTLGETIRARRKELHYTQAYLAEFTGLSVTFISDVERGKTTAEIEKIIRLINGLGLNLLVEKRE